jgi:hypothetical protein
MPGWRSSVMSILCECTRARVKRSQLAACTASAETGDSALRGHRRR